MHFQQDPKVSPVCSAIELIGSKKVTFNARQDNNQFQDSTTLSMVIAEQTGVHFLRV